MGSWMNDSQLQSLMGNYLAAATRLDHADRDELPDDEVEKLRAEKRAAARTYEEALLARGWQIPGLVVGPMARLSRW
jgi:hypothetical protein